MSVYDENSFKPLPPDVIWSDNRPIDRRRHNILLIEPTRHLMLMSAYASFDQRPKEFAFYTYMPSFSDENCATYRKVDGSEWVIAIRGACTASDVGACIRHFLGMGIGNTKRYQSALRLCSVIKQYATKEGGDVKLTGHSLGGLVAAKLNYDLFGGNAQTVCISLRVFDKDTWKVYAQPNTYVIAKPDDIVCTFIFVLAPGNAFISTLTTLHALGEAEYHSDDPFNEDPEIALLSVDEISLRLDEGMKFVSENLAKTIPFYGAITLGVALNAVKYYNENLERGPVAALQWASKNDGLQQLTNEALLLLVKTLFQIAINLTAKAVGYYTGPIGEAVVKFAGNIATSEVLEELEFLLYATLFHAPPTPLMACMAPPLTHFEKYDPVGSIKPIE